LNRGCFASTRLSYRRISLYAAATSYSTRISTEHPLSSAFRDLLRISPSGRLKKYKQNYYKNIKLNVNI